MLVFDLTQISQMTKKSMLIIKLAWQKKFTYNIEKSCLTPLFLGKPLLLLRNISSIMNMSGDPQDVPHESFGPLGFALDPLDPLSFVLDPWDLHGVRLDL